MVADASLSGREMNYVFLISVSSSGRLCRLFRKLAPAGSKIAVICRTSDEVLPCEHDLVTSNVKSWPAGTDGRCERCNTKPRIHVDPKTYELLPHLEWQSV